MRFSLLTNKQIEISLNNYIYFFIHTHTHKQAHLLDEDMLGKTEDIEGKFCKGEWACSLI